MKKIVSILLCMVMLVSAFTVFPYAADDGGNVASPVVDGVVNAEEYMTERTFNNLNPDGTHNTDGFHVDFAPWRVPSDGADIVEYASEDDDYIYVAFVINKDMSAPDFFMTGRAEAAATIAEHKNTTRFYFDLSSTNQTTAVVYETDGRDGDDFTTDGTEMRAYRSDEFESIAKRNKNGNAFQNITVELKISKKAIMDICKVPSVEFIGYQLVCNGMETYSGDSLVELCATILSYSDISDSGFSHLKELTDCYVNELEYELHNDNDTYGYGWKMLRFICFYEEPEVKAWYGPVGSKSPSGVDRAPALDYTDISRFSTTSTYVYTKAEEVIDGPVVDGVISKDEYTASKVYAADASLQWQWTTSKGVTLTEYGAQDADYVYFALEFDKAISSTEIYFDATNGVRYDWDGMQDYDWFTFSGINADGVAGTYSVWVGGNIDQTSIAKTTDGKTVIEIKMSKESVKSAFGLDSFDAFAYYVNGAVLADGTGSIGNYTFLDNAEMDEHFSGRESAIKAEYGLGSWYPSHWILGNIVVLTGEELPETPAFYCPAGDDCTVSGHANRSEVFDLADLRDFGLLEGLFVPAPGEKVFSIAVAFGSMSFNYVAGSNSGWNPDTHQYEEMSAGWSCDKGANKLTVRNMSEFAILTTFVYQKAEGFDTIEGTFDTAVARLAGTDEGDDLPNAKVASYLELTGELNAQYSQETEIGQIVIKLMKANS